MPRGHDGAVVPAPDRLPALLAALVRTRRLVRAPIALYRVRLGFLLGRRFLLLEHVGRRTGARRFAVLEVVDRPGPDRLVVAAALGERSQWWRNALARPAVRVSTGLRRSVPATARPLPPHEAVTVLDRYARHHPRAWRAFEPLLRRGAGLPAEAPLGPHARLMEFRLGS